MKNQSFTQLHFQSVNQLAVQLWTGSKNYSKKEKGISIIELMIGLTVGLLVVIAAAGSLIFTKETEKTVNDSTQLQQKANLIFSVLGSHIYQAGSISMTDLDVATHNESIRFRSDYEGLNKVFNVSGEPITSVRGKKAWGASNTDLLSVAYQSQVVNSTNCMGAATTNVDQTIVFQFFIRRNNATNTNELRCAPAIFDVNDLRTSSLIADNVNDFQVTYGIRDAAGQSQTLDAAAVSNWSQVQNVSICLLLSGDTTNNPVPVGFQLRGCDGATVIPNDGRLRKVFRKTFAVRNVI